MRAAKFDNGFVVKKLLMSGARPDIRDKSGKTALDYAAGYDYFDAAFMLLAKANANLADPAGRTPLMTAVANSSLKTVLAYVAAFEFEQNAAAEAASKTAEERKEMLTVAAAFRKINMNLRDTEGKTALMLAAAKGNAEVVKALLTMKPNRKLADKSGKTALEIARANGHAEIAKLLSGR
jgi:uncharacterized protein